jgi:glycogen debranching enzyme
VSHPRSRRDGSYVVEGAGLPSGSTLGGPDLCVVLKGNGTIERIVSLAAGAEIFSGVGMRHWETTMGIHLEANDERFVLRPHSQEHQYRLGDHVHVSETTFVLDGGFESPAACYIVARIKNTGPRRLSIASVLFARIAVRMTDADVHARYDEQCRALIVWNGNGAPCARAVAASIPPASWSVTTNHARAVDDRWNGTFDETIDVRGSDPLGVLHLEHSLEPEAEVAYDFVCAALPAGAESATEVLAALPASADALAATAARYREALDRSCLLCPQRQVDLGVLWSKANQLRVMRRTPTGLGFTNDPGRSNAMVGRDAAWFVHGCDWMEPPFSLALLRGFASRQERDGKIVEWYDLRSGETHDDALDVNDDTPLFILAVYHHAVTTGDRTILTELYPTAARAAEQLLAHRDERGLVWCSSKGTGARGIAGWRNIIEGYRISGATTELNSETYGALRRLALMAGRLGEENEGDRWDRAAAELHDAIERHLRNPENGLYHLAIDVDGTIRSDLTCDVVFPVVFGVCDDVTGSRIVARLRQRDFWTEAGLRTVPRGAPEYSPTNESGLLGGVWVAVTFWFAFAAAKFVPDVMGAALETSFAHYARDPQQTNTVPGQFSEWLHGETLANQGMMLSPWFAPRYLWAAVEGAAGLEPRFGRSRLTPRIPAQWNWLAMRNVMLGGQPTTWVVVRGARTRILATADFESDLEVERFEHDVTSDVRVEGHDVALVALDDGRRVLVFLGNRESHTVTVAIARDGILSERALVRRFEGLLDLWCDEREARSTSPVPVTLERGGFALFEFV